MKIKFLVIMLMATVHLFAISQKSVEFYVKRHIEKKMHSKVEKIETLSSYQIGGTKGWKVYFLVLDLKVKMGNVYRNRTLYQVVYNKGKKIAFSLKDKKGNDYSKVLKPHVPLSAYNESHLLVGNKDARHKILVVSDPFCPFCQEIVPKLIESVERHPKTFALYYYHLPLVRIHPASDVTTKAMHIFQKRGNLKALKECYHLLVSEREKNPQVILDAIKRKTGITLTQKEINSKEIKETMAFDKAMKKRLMVTGTPTIFIDGIWDPSRSAYKKLIPKHTENSIESEEKGFFASLFN